MKKFIAVLCLLLGGCAMVRQPIAQPITQLPSVTTMPSAVPVAEDISIGLGQINKSITDSTSSIDKNANDIVNKSKDPVITNDAIQIKALNDLIKAQNQQIANLQVKTDELTKSIATVEENAVNNQKVYQDQINSIKDTYTKQTAKLTTQLDQEKTKSTQLLNMLLSFIVAGSVLSAAIGGYMTFTGNIKSGAGLMVAGGIASVSGLAILTQSTVLGILGVGLAIVGVVAIIVMVLKQKTTAIDQIVKTTQLAKTQLPQVAKEAIFGGDLTPTIGQAHVIQSLETSAIVKDSLKRQGLTD